MRQLREIGGDAAIEEFAKRRVQAIVGDVEPADPTDVDNVEATADAIAEAFNAVGFAASTRPVATACRSANTIARFPMWQKSFRNCARQSSKHSGNCSGLMFSVWRPSPTVTAPARRTCPSCPPGVDDRTRVFYRALPPCSVRIEIFQLVLQSQNCSTTATSPR